MKFKDELEVVRVPIFRTISALALSKKTYYCGIYHYSPFEYGGGVRLVRTAERVEPILKDMARKKFRWICVINQFGVTI